MDLELKLVYGNDGMRLNLPENMRIDSFEPAAVPAAVTYESFRGSFLDAGGERFCFGVEPMIVVNDGSRSTPTGSVLDWLDKIDGALLDRASFLVAAGTHEPPTPEHYLKIFGSHYARVRERILIHDARDYGSMDKIGVDRYGRDVWLNRAVLKGRPVVFISSVEPHYFAGFTGGRKSLFPGLTDFATIERNHNLANSLEAKPLRISGNPMAEHLQEMLDMTDSLSFFSIQVVVDAHKQIAGAFCGDLNNSFQQAAGLADRIYARSVAEPYDAVIGEMRPPLDSNLYQAQKALENCQAAVKDGGSAIVVSACEEGIGSDHFWQLAGQWDRQNNAARDGQQHFGSHKLARVNLMSRRIGVRLVSKVPDNDVRRVFYEPLGDLQGFLLSEMSRCDKYRVAVVHDAGHMVLKT